jgi:hypothetical protein
LVAAVVRQTLQVLLVNTQVMPTWELTVTLEMAKMVEMVSPR